MRTSTISNAAIAGLIGFAGHITTAAGQSMQTACDHSDQQTVVSVAEWYDIVDIPYFCDELRKNREGTSGCQAAGNPICEVADGSFEWSFTTDGGSCSKDDVHAIWTAAGGNELVGFIYC